MAFKMSKNSLFAILLRSAWWYSVSIGLAFIALSLLIANGQYLILGVTGAIPFFGIATVAAYRQSKLPSQKRIIEVYEQAQKMPANAIAKKIVENYTDAGYDTIAFKGTAAEFELTRGYRKILLSSKRFKAGNTGIEPLKNLVAAGEKAEATGYLYVALGSVSDAAVKYANENNIELIQAPKLAQYFDKSANIDT